jgi:hypothetical protein
MGDTEIRTLIAECGESPALLREMVLNPRAFGARFGLSQRDVDALEAANAFLLSEGVDSFVN